MDAVEFLKAKSRMLKAHENGCGILCAECNFRPGKTGRGVSCGAFRVLYPEEAVAIVQKWVEEHPVKTRMSDFFDKHPDATKREDGRPLVCACHVGYEERKRCELTEDCWKCWNKPLEEE